MDVQKASQRMQDALDKLPPELKEICSPFVDAHNRLLIENRLLREQLRLALIKKYGASSEKLSDAQLSLLQEEPSVTGAEVEQEALHAEEDSPKAKSKPRKKPPGRVDLPDHLERREETIACSPEECTCHECGALRPIIGYERSEQLEVDPAVYWVKVLVREKRGDCPAHPDQGVTCAPAPERIIPKSKLADSMIVDVVVKKFGDHLPAYRQSNILYRDAGVEISRQTLVDGILKVGDLCQAIIPELKLDLIEGGYIQADETRVPCQTTRVRGRNHTAFMWEYGRPYGPVVFDFRLGRSREGPAKFLEGYKGVLQCDGYSAYNKLGEGIDYAGCLAHVRREFHRAHELQKEDPRPREILDLIGQIYEVEKDAREENAGPARRLAMREERSKGLFHALRERIVALRANPDVLPSSQLGKACQYALGQWARLEVCLENGQVEVDNNWCENAIRPLVVGRKNWLHIGSEQAGPKIAAIASIFETCRRLGINVRSYLLDILPKLPEWPANRVGDLGPVSWQSRQIATKPPTLPQPETRA